MADRSREMSMSVPSSQWDISSGIKTADKSSEEQAYYENDDLTEAVLGSIPSKNDLQVRHSSPAGNPLATYPLWQSRGNDCTTQVLPQLHLDHLSLDAKTLRKLQESAPPGRRPESILYGTFQEAIPPINYEQSTLGRSEKAASPDITQEPILPVSSEFPMLFARPPESRPPAVPLPRLQLSTPPGRSLNSIPPASPGFVSSPRILQESMLSATPNVSTPSLSSARLQMPIIPSNFNQPSPNERPEVPKLPIRPQELTPPALLYAGAESVGADSIRSNSAIGSVYYDRIKSVEIIEENEYDMPNYPVTLRRPYSERPGSAMEIAISQRQTKSEMLPSLPYMAMQGLRMSKSNAESYLRPISYGDNNYVEMTPANIRPDTSNPIQNKRGWLHKMGKNKKDWSKCWCHANEKNLEISEDKSKTLTARLLSSSFLNIVILQKIFTYNHSNLYCFEIRVKGPKDEKCKAHTFGASNLVERHDWVFSIWELITPTRNVAMSMVSAATKAGRFQYKETVSGIWQPAWLALSDRKLTLWPEDDVKPIDIDIRKVKSLIHQKDSSKYDASNGNFVGTTFNLNYSGKTMHIRSIESSETDETFKLVMAAWNAIGYELEDQLLTPDDIPVIVDMCTKHIFIHGLKVQDIYKARRDSTSKVDLLMDLLRKDPFQVNLSSDNYTVHDVADVLKGFLQKLANPLLTNELGLQWQAVAAAAEDVRPPIVTDLVFKIPEIHHKTLRYLLTHLRSVIHCQSQNGMSERDIVNEFGPIIIGESVGDDSRHVGRIIITCMLKHFEAVFDVDENELQMEKEMLKLALQPKVELMNVRTTKISSAGILISVYVDNRALGKCVPFTLLPKMTAKDVCMEILKVVKRPVVPDKYFLCEVVCGGTLERPVHFAELVLEVTLRWMNWDDQDAGQNYLLVKLDDIFCKILPLVPILQKTYSVTPLTSEVHLAKAKNKAFKKVVLKFKHAQLSYVKDKKKTEPKRYWNIEDLVWYIGHESLRSPPTKYTFTFFERSAAVQRTKNRPYIGMTVCMSNEAEWYALMAMMLSGEHPKGLLPT